MKAKKILLTLAAGLLIVPGAWADNGKGKHKGKHKNKHAHEHHSVVHHDNDGHRGDGRDRNDGVNRTLTNEVHRHESNEIRHTDEVVVRRDTNSSAPVMAHACPFSCATLNIAKSQCRDWREGDLCFVQDLNSRKVPYRVINAPVRDRDYYLIEAPRYRGTGVTAGEVVADKVGAAIDRAIGR